MSELPAAARSRLGGHLKFMRRQRQLTSIGVSAEMQWSIAKLSRMESGERSVRYTDLFALLNLYEVEGLEREWILDLLATSQQDSPYKAFADVADETDIAFIEAVHSCALLLEHSGGLIPALLQIPAYADFVFGADWVTKRSTERQIALLAERQREFLRTDGPNATFVMSESAFLRIVGGKEVVRQQYLSLLDLPARISVRVLPFSAPPMVGQRAAFALARGFDRCDDLAAIELAPGHLLLRRERAQINLLDAAFGELLEHATTAEQLPAIVRWALSNLEQERWQPWAAAA